MREKKEKDGVRDVKKGKCGTEVRSLMDPIRRMP
jgi:hypothetical protein